MNGYVANKDFDWFRYLRALYPPVQEVNFWLSGETSFAALQPGEPLVFKLKTPHNAIAGVGFFALYSRLSFSLLWDSYDPSTDI